MVKTVKEASEAAEEAERRRAIAECSDQIFYSKRYNDLEYEYR
jgi:hypothetical protein